MGSISAGDLTLLRDRKDAQYSIERLYGLGFPEMWRGQVNDASIARGDQTLTTDGGAMQGTYVFADLEAGLMLFVGSSAGSDDKGRRRILSISGVEATPTIIVDWNDDIDWQDDDHLTIVHVYPPWPKYSWFTSTGPDFRKDGPPSSEGGAGIDYSDQNEQPPPLVIMGPHYANELTGASLVVQLSAANSQAVADGATISSYSWSVAPTGPTFSNSAISNPTITFTTEDKYWVSCTVTDSNGKTSTGHRAYIIGGAVTEFSRGPITETYDDPSVDVQITLTSPETTDTAAIRPVMTWSDFADQSLVIITSEDYYGSTQKAISFRDAAQYTDHLHILYVGYLYSENDDLIDDGSGTVTLNAVSTIPMFLYSLSLEGVENASDWYEMNKELMTVAANLFHLFKYQSTLLDIMDWHLPWSDTVLRSANEEFNEGSLIDRARALAGARLMAITAVSLGEVWVETDLNLRDSTDRTAEDTTLTLTDNDISGTKRARKRQYGDNIRVLLDGGSSDGLLGSFTPFLSASADVATSKGRPQMVNFPRLMLPSQTEANRLAGRIATVANGEYQEVNLELSGNYRGVFSPGDQQKIDLGNIFAGSLQANIRGYTDLESVDVICRSVTFNHADGYTSVTLVADIMQDEGITGVTITAPSVPEDAILPGSGTDADFDLPAAPAFPPIPPNETVPGPAVGVDEDDGIYWTLDSGSTWETRNDSLSTAGGQYLIWDPWWFTQFGNNSNNPEDVILWWVGTGFIRRSVDAGKNWDDLTALAGDPPNVAEDGSAPTFSDVTYRRVHGDIHTNGEFFFIVEWQNASSEWRGWLLKTTDNGASFTWDSIEPVGTAGEWVIAPSGFKGVNSASGGPLGTGTIDQDGASFTISSVQRQGSSDHVVGLMIAGYDDGSGEPVFIDSTVTLESVVPNISSPTNIRDRDNDCGNGILFNQASTEPGDMPETLDDNLAFLYVLVGSFDFTLSIDTPPDRCSGAAAPERPLEMDIDLEDGSRIWVTKWTEAEFPGDTGLYLQNYDTSLQVQDSIQIMLTVTEAEIDARTYYIAPYCPPFFDTASFGSIVYVYGRWDDGTVKHLVKSTDEGATLTDIGDSGTWGAGWVGGFFADDANTLYAFVNGASRALYRSTDAGNNWSNLSSLPFDVDAGSVSKHPDGRILIANRSAAAQMVAYATTADDYASWTDATGSPAFSTSGGGARSVVWVT